MKNTRIGLAIPSPLLLLTVPFLALALQVARPVHASTQGSLSMSTEGGSVIERNIPIGAQVDISDSDTSTGGAGNTAAGGYSASITGASLSASASAQNGLHAGGPPPDYWNALASTSTTLHDNLRFTIPAGSYPSGLYAVARVHVQGGVTASGGAGALYIYGITFGESVSVHTSPPAPPVFEDIELAAELLAPGVTLSSPTTVMDPFVATIQAVATASEEVAQSSSSDLAIQVTCISVPPGVTWVSDSGVFGAPTCSASVPGLESWGVASLVLALAGTALWITSGRRPEMA